MGMFCLLQDLYEPQWWSKSGAAGTGRLWWETAQSGPVAAPRPHVYATARGQEKRSWSCCCLDLRHQVRNTCNSKREHAIHYSPLTCKTLLFFSKCEVSLDYSLPRKSSLSSDSNKTFCMLGHCTPSSGELLKQTRHWSMGTVLLFNGKNTENSPHPYLTVTMWLKRLKPHWNHFPRWSGMHLTTHL